MTSLPYSAAVESSPSCAALLVSRNRMAPLWGLPGWRCSAYLLLFKECHIDGSPSFDFSRITSSCTNESFWSCLVHTGLTPFSAGLPSVFCPTVFASSAKGTIILLAGLYSWYRSPREHRAVPVIKWPSRVHFKKKKIHFCSQNSF